LDFVHSPSDTDRSGHPNLAHVESLRYEYRMFRLVTPLLVLVLCGCLSPKKPKAEMSRYEFEEPQMGVPFRITLYALDSRQAANAAQAAFQRDAGLNAMMSDYETDSEISRLSRSSEEGAPAVPVSEDLWAVLSTAQQLARESQGAFDVTVGPCAALWRKARREKQMPDAARLANARGKVGFQNLVLDKGTRTARLLQPGMRLDLGGIAKGYAADQALKTLRAHGIRSALVSASGDLAMGDAPPKSKGWRVEIVGHDVPGGPASRVVLLENRGVATSGDLFQRLEIDGVRYSHILNPFTCVGMTNHALVTVIARDCMTADMLATTCTIMVGDDAPRLADKYDAAARLVRLDKSTPFPVENRRFRNLVEAP
jgi:thiamine biosynthesis lipoprotein